MVHRAVRKARPEDADEMGEMHVASWREAYAHLLSREFLAALDPTDRARMWASAIAQHPGCVHVATVDGEIVGLSAARSVPDGPRDLLLPTLYLLEAHHGSGLGQALLDAAVGDRPAFCWVAEDNPRARAFYARNGFLPDGERDVVPEWENLVEIRLVR